MSDNFERMLELVNDAFNTRNDPDQISVTEDEQKKLHLIHPATLSELANEDGPIVWILIIPTTNAIKNSFIKGDITERQLLEETMPGIPFETIYLCSATVLPEFRGKGLAKQVTMDAVKRICDIHPIRSLFYWPFSEGGRMLAESIAALTGLPLEEKPGNG